MAEVIRGVKFGGELSSSDRRAIALHDYVVAAGGYPISAEELKAKLVELKKAIPDPENSP